MPRSPFVPLHCISRLCTVLCIVGLQELANAKGNILENKDLLDSLNQTKQNSITITQSLAESVKLQTSLDAVRSAESDSSDSYIFVRGGPKK